MHEDFLTTPKKQVNFKDYVNFKSALGAFFILLAIWVLVWTTWFSPLAIYLGGFSLAILGLAFLLSGVKKKRKITGNYKINI